MKKTMLIFSLLILGIKVEAQDSIKKANYPFQGYGKVAYISWDNNNDVTEAYGKMPLLGAGIEKKISEDVKGGLGFGLGRLEDGGYTLKYSEMGLSLEYAWYAFGSNNPNVIGGFSGKRISLEEETPDGDKNSGDGFGFSIKVGIEIPIGSKTSIECGWESTFADIEILEETLNLDNLQVYGKIIFKL